MPDFSNPPLIYYAPPGVLRLSPEALKKAHAFDRALRKMPGVRDPVLVFSWATARSVRRSPDGHSDQVGPGLGLGASERSDVPEKAVQTIDGLDVAMQIPAEVYEKSRSKLIDVDESAFEKLTLR